MNEGRKNILRLVFLGVAVIAGGIGIYEQVRVQTLRNESRQLRTEISNENKELQLKTMELMKARAAVEKQKKDVDGIQAELEKNLKKKK